MEPQQLMKEIHYFLAGYAKLSPDYLDDPDSFEADIEGKYIAPDPYEFEAVKIQLKKGIKPQKVFSDYKQGGYVDSRFGKEIHEKLIEEIKKMAT